MASYAAGPLVLLDAHDCELLLIVARPNALRLAQRNGAAEAALMTLIGLLERCARTGKPQPVAQPRRAAGVLAPDRAGSPVMGWAGVQPAAARLGVTAKCARELCRRGVLSAVKDADGRWLIDPASLAAEAGRREERNRT